MGLRGTIGHRYEKPMEAQSRRFDFLGTGPSHPSQDAAQTSLGDDLFDGAARKPPEASSAVTLTTFASYLRRTRQRTNSTQLTLSRVVGCSDAAWSLWEGGVRTPLPSSFQRILAAFAQLGVTTGELLELRALWATSRARAAARAGPAKADLRDR